jgi:hypothetical protein
MATNSNSDLAHSSSSLLIDDQVAAPHKSPSSLGGSDGPNSTDYPDTSAVAMSKPATEKGIGSTNDNTGSKVALLPQEKLQEWTAVAQKKGPLQLLDLPMDVLKEIIKEVSFAYTVSFEKLQEHMDSADTQQVTHTNDLTALALTHSALHNLAIPHIYSRFDIVWPDAQATTEARTGVDALTYGLATLAMGPDVFGDCSVQHDLTNTWEGQTIHCTSCGATNNVTKRPSGRVGASPNVRGQRRLGNRYPQYTRKFSLGNGPSEWVQEYMITKESGKMLGTLVALAVARMVNLETFIWDVRSSL